MDFVTSFVDFIMNLIGYIQAIVKYYRDKNDGKETEMPAFPTFGKKDDGAEG